MATSIGRSVFWSLAESGGLSLLSFALLVVVARLVGPAELGIVALALGVVQFLTIFIETIFHDALVQRDLLDDEHLDTAFWSCAGLGTGFTVAVWFAAPLVAELFSAEALQPVLQVMCVSLFMSGLGAVPAAALRRRMNFKALALRSLLARAAAAVAAIAMAALGMGIWSLVAQQVLQSAGNALLVWPAAAWRPRCRFSFRHLRQLLAFGLFSAGTRIVWLSSLRLFTVLVGLFMGMAAVGTLNIAQRAIDTLHDLLAGAAYNLGLPVFSRRQKDGEALARAHHRATQYAGLAALPLFAGIAVTAAPVIEVFLGSAWTGAAGAMRILALAASIQLLFLFSTIAITARGRPGLVFSLSLLSFAFATLSMLAIQPQSVAGAAALWAARSLLTMPILMYFASDILPAPWRSMWQAVRAPLIATGVMVAALSALQIYVQPIQDAGALTQLAVLVPGGIAIYSLSVFALDWRSATGLLRFLAAAVRTGKRNVEANVAETSQVA